MKNVLLFVMAILLMASDVPDGIESAKEIAAREHKLILIRFTGSDWCSPCMSMDKRVFSNRVFRQYADGHLVEIEADFPRGKDLDKEVRHRNRVLARKYQKTRVYPYTVLVDADGKILETWYGYAGQTVDFYITHINNHFPGQYSNAPAKKQR